MATKGLYHASWTDKKTGETKHAATWSMFYQKDGKQVRESCGTRNEAKAKAKLQERNGQVAIGVPTGPQISKTTLTDVLGMLEAHYTANGRKSLWRARFAAKHLVRLLGNYRKARDLTPDTMTQYQATRLAEGAAAATVNYEIAVLKRALHLGAKAGKVGVRHEFDMLQVHNTRTGFFEPEQYRAVLGRLPGYLQPVIQVAYITGWRTRSELLTRQWRHIDMVNGWLVLDPGEAKNQQARRFPFTPELRAVLEGQRERVSTIERKTGQIIPHVFVHDTGTPIKAYRDVWKRACREAGIPGRIPHDFRRTAVRNLERAGVPRSASMAMTGHKTASVFTRYAIVDSTMLQEAAAKLATLHESERTNADRKDAGYSSSIKVSTVPVTK
jgi:integrase